ncbi:hypothetical protein KIL84_018380 [Mauremys mutica]|uniref:Ig-like domain-containing protein n=1 Tax=Mauremys mutica TaxID=74926 RepID=A0A9D3XU96_9SAUR|nr:hypothetical protein KIL84_018380 [Mauremys mutica]
MVGTVSHKSPESTVNTIEVRAVEEEDVSSNDTIDDDDDDVLMEDGGDRQWFLEAGDPVRIEADEGEDVLLPCIVERRAADRRPNPTVNWQRSGSEVVKSYFNGKNHPVYQSGRYKGRTEFTSQGLSEGNASLLLKNVTPADFGNYTCHASLYENSPQTLHTVLLMQKETQALLHFLPSATTMYPVFPVQSLRIAHLRVFSPRPF